MTIHLCHKGAKTSREKCERTQKASLLSVCFLEELISPPLPHQENRLYYPYITHQRFPKPFRTHKTARNMQKSRCYSTVHQLTRKLLRRPWVWRHPRPFFSSLYCHHSYCPSKSTPADGLPVSFGARCCPDHGATLSPGMNSATAAYHHVFYPPAWKPSWPENCRIRLPERLLVHP